MLGELSCVILIRGKPTWPTYAVAVQPYRLNRLD